MSDRESEQPELVLPADFDDHGWLLESKGCYLDATVRWAGEDFMVSFYDPVRLAQEVEADLGTSGRAELTRVVVVGRLTGDSMKAAVRDLSPTFFELSRP